MNMKFCENFRLSRISADKRFLYVCSHKPASLAPDRGFWQTVCIRKVNKVFNMFVYI